MINNGENKKEESGLGHIEGDGGKGHEEGIGRIGVLEIQI